MSMSHGWNSPQFAIDAPVDARMAFIRRTYLHLAAAVLTFVLLSTLFHMAGLGYAVLKFAGSIPFGYFLLLGGFILVGWVASSMAHSTHSLGAQYAGLVLYTVAEAVFFSPLIFLAATFAPAALPISAAVTLLVFGGLSLYVLVTKQDFSFLRTALFIGSMIALGLIVAGAIFGFSLGVWFSAAMILFASGAILYSTSKVLHEYYTDQHVGAAVELFASVALLFWYVLQLVLSLTSRD